MKKLLVIALFAVLGMPALAQGQPDPRDSIILESKTVNPQAGTGGVVRLKVYITNKDTLAFMTVALRERTTVGAAYMTLSYPRTFSGVVENLTNTLRYYYFSRLSPNYTSSSPDSFVLSAGFYAAGPCPSCTIEPPNAVRKAVWEIKFDTVLYSGGAIEFDSCRLVGSFCGFTNTVPRDVYVNFLKSTVTVEIKGDLNQDDVVSPADVVWELMCVYLGNIPPAGQSACDVNCDGEVTPADVAVFLTYKFLTLTWPC